MDQLIWGVTSYYHVTGLCPRVIISRLGTSLNTDQFSSNCVVCYFYDPGSFLCSDTSYTTSVYIFSHSRCAMSQPWFREPREHGVADGLQFTSTGALGSWAAETLAPDSRAEETMGSECFHHQNIKYLEKNRACQEPLCHFLSGLQTINLCLVNVTCLREPPPSLSQVFTPGYARLGAWWICVS